jgi:hypothetical protein
MGILALGPITIYLRTGDSAYWSQSRFRSHNARDMQDVYLVIRFTRHWIHYGFIAHVTLFTIVAAVEGVLGK